MKGLVIPIATEGTLTRFKEKLGNYPIIDTPLIKAEVFEDRIIEMIKMIKSMRNPEEYIHIFTSKSSIAFLGPHVKADNAYIFRRCICIGKATAEALDRLLRNLSTDYEVHIPSPNTSIGVLTLLKGMYGYPIYWSSFNPNWELVKHIIHRGGCVNVIYKVYLDEASAEGVTQLLRDYERIYLIFPSAISLDYLRFIGRIEDREIIGIFLSNRIYLAADTHRLNKVYVYESSDIEEFYDFVRGVLNEA